ncbi:BrnA antitoxin family protein [Methyloprofundus sp.]|uniref:BrnA antitoxin family protein n=1 Tax=Methyloprofundus sp. TaxID=2020875 RepID=UPI003D1475B6
MQQSQTDWKKIDAMEDKDINLSELSEASHEQFAKAIVRKNLKPVQGKTQITLRLDTDVLNWFKAQGQGYQTNINALLKVYKDANQNQSLTKKSR